MGYFTEESEEMAEELKKKKLERVKNAPLLGKWIKVLFWLQVLAIVGNVLESDFLKGLPPVVYLAGIVIGYGVVIAESVILIRLKKIEDWFFKAGICFLISGFSGFVTVLLLILEIEVFASLFLNAVAIVELVGLYEVYTGFEIVLKNVDDELSEQWPLQWKWEFRCVIVTVVAMFFADFPGFLGIVAVIALLIAGIGGIILGIRRMVNMYRTAECFRAYALWKEPDENEQ